MPVQDEGFIMWLVGGVSAIFLAVIRWMNGRIKERVHLETFKQYVDGQEKLTEAHVKSVETLTESVIRAHDRIDTKQDKKT